LVKVANDENEESVENMQAEEVERIANGLRNFGGIFRLNQLPRVKIVSLPVSIIILAYTHWLGVYVDENVIEIMDSTGHLGTDGVHRSLRRFLYGHVYNKIFTITPRLQADQSDVCAFYALSFLYYRTYTTRTLCDFVKLFSANTNTNCQIITEIFATILKLEKCLIFPALENTTSKSD